MKILYKNIFLLVALFVSVNCFSAPPKPFNSNENIVNTKLPAICANYNHQGTDNLKDSNLGSREIWDEFNNYYKDRTERNLIVFFDGTANDKSDLTNVRALYKLAIQRACKNDSIIPFYDKGVGKSTDTLLGDIFGLGTSLNIRQGYRFLVEAYKPGDKIYIFGFSRGAFEARSLNGLIEFAGLLDRRTISRMPSKLPKELWFLTDYENTVKDIYDQYRVHGDDSELFQNTLRKSIHDYEKKNYPNLNFLGIQVEGIGVFDTVPAVGIKRYVDPSNHRLDLYAKKGFHALSLDERRNDFKLNRFNKLHLKTNQVLKEVWFPGGHMNIGGGYDKSMDCNISNDKDEYYYDGLETIPLNWMIANFKDDHLFPDDIKPFQECVEGKLHDEYFDGLEIYKTVGISTRFPQEKDSLHKSISSRINAKLYKNHKNREPDGFYKPTNIMYPVDKYYSVTQ